MFTGCDVKVDIVFVLDISVSIGGGKQKAADKNFKEVTTFVSNMVQFLNIGPDNSLVGVVLFARDAVINFNVLKYTDMDDLLNAINSLEFGNIKDEIHQTTNTPAALNLLRAQGHNDGALRLRYDGSSHIVVFVTYGEANTSEVTGNSRKKDAENTEIAARDLHESNIYSQIYSVGIRGKNNEINKTQLEVIASHPSLAYTINDFDKQIFEELRVILINLICKSK